MSSNVINNNANDSPCKHSLRENSYCYKCGAIGNYRRIASKHIKYSYKAEISPKEIYKKMVQSNHELYQYYPLPEIPSSNFTSLYKSKRKELFTIIKTVNTKLDFNSQTFFLSVYYMDEIFIKNESFFSQSSLADHLLICLCCLIISSKFNENDPKVPDMFKYNNILSEVTKFKYNFSQEDIRSGEIICLKLLEYKLNYYSIYHYIVFFFAHGIFFKEDYEKNGNNKKMSKRKTLEKIYIQSRELLDCIIEDENDFLYGNSAYNHLCAVIILQVVIHNIFNMSFNYMIDEYSSSYDVFKELYDIDTVNDSATKNFCEVFRDKVIKLYKIKASKKKITKCQSVKTNNIQNDLLNHKNLISSNQNQKLEGESNNCVNIDNMKSNNRDNIENVNLNLNNKIIMGDDCNKDKIMNIAEIGGRLDDKESDYRTKYDYSNREKNDNDTGYYNSFNYSKLNRRDYFSNSNSNHANYDVEKNNMNYNYNDYIIDEDKEINNIDKNYNGILYKSANTNSNANLLSNNSYMPNKLVMNNYNYDIKRRRLDKYNLNNYEYLEKIDKNDKINTNSPLDNANDLFFYRNSSNNDGINNFEKIKNDFGKSKNDLDSDPLRKRACSLNKENKAANEKNIELLSDNKNNNGYIDTNNINLNYSKSINKSKGSTNSNKKPTNSYIASKYLSNKIKLCDIDQDFSISNMNSNTQSNKNTNTNTNNNIEKKYIRKNGKFEYKYSHNLNSNSKSKNENKLNSINSIDNNSKLKETKDAKTLNSIKYTYPDDSIYHNRESSTTVNLNEMPYKKYTNNRKLINKINKTNIKIDKTDLGIDMNTKTTTNVHPEDILDKTKKIFEQSLSGSNSSSIQNKLIEYPGSSSYNSNYNINAKSLNSNGTENTTNMDTHMNSIYTNNDIGNNIGLSGSSIKSTQHNRRNYQNTYDYPIYSNSEIYENELKNSNFSNMPIQSKHHQNNLDDDLNYNTNKDSSNGNTIIINNNININAYIQRKNNMNNKFRSNTYNASTGTTNKNHTVDYNEKSNLEREDFSSSGNNYNKESLYSSGISSTDKYDRYNYDSDYRQSLMEPKVPGSNYMHSNSSSINGGNNNLNGDVAINKYGYYGTYYDYGYEAPVKNDSTYGQVNDGRNYYDYYSSKQRSASGLNMSLLKKYNNNNYGQY